MTQLSLLDPSPAAHAALAVLAQAPEETRGAVFTRREVVDFMLDLAAYTVDQPLQEYRILEPAFGHGEFLVAIVERLLEAYRGNDPVRDLADAVRGCEVHAGSARETRRKLRGLLFDAGCSASEADTLLDAWLIVGDFLLADLPGSFTHVVGNPPYIRQEMVSAALMAEYRARYATIYDRADIYVPFFEKGLRLLAPEGRLAFICSDRWTKNRYGGPLRAFVAEGYSLGAYVDMVDTPAFHSEVIAYPAITLIARRPGAETRVAYRPEVEPALMRRLAAALRGAIALPEVAVVRGVVRGAEPWMLHAADRTALLRRLEAYFPTLERAGCTVGIGVATGADKVFIGPYDALDVEPDRKLRLATTKDIKSGHVVWKGLGVVNPFDADGKLVSLTDHPKLAAYLERHGEVIRARNVAKRAPESWYRTIDRISPALAARPKLLIPDIKGSAHIVLENEGLYPHHNLYYIVSDRWPLAALRAVLGSGIAQFFVSAYTVKMAGGHLRFQAQYLRRIRVPEWEAVDAGMRERLIAAGASDKLPLWREAAFDLYGLSDGERTLVAGIADGT